MIYTTFPRRSYWLRRLENYGRKERVPVDEYTIEHILPQNDNLSAEWREELGPEWQRVQDNWLHTLGNLTLTGYNTEYSDRPFSEKREMKGGFGESPLRLNEGLRSLDKWDEAAIKSQGSTPCRCGRGCMGGSFFASRGTRVVPSTPRERCGLHDR